ncbi:MAG: iron-containing alcohol dehydrogenase, partial [Desulfuromonadales bacterium]
SQAGRYAKNHGARKVLVVSDPGVVAAGWTADVIASLEEEGLPHVLFTGVSPNPRAAEVMAGAAIYEAEKCNALVAVGGGSPMDCAKGIGIVSSNGRDILTFEGVDQVQVPMPPLICVPTTGGTSADVSQFAIITNPFEKIKFAIISKSVVPDLSLIDPVTLTSMDPFLTGPQSWRGAFWPASPFPMPFWELPTPWPTASEAKKTLPTASATPSCWTT